MLRARSRKRRLSLRLLRKINSENVFVCIYILEGSKGDTRKGDGEKHPENKLKTP